MLFSSSLQVMGKIWLVLADNAATVALVLAQRIAAASAFPS